MMRYPNTFIDGNWIDGARRLAIRDKFTGAVIGEVGIADRGLVDGAVAAARRAFQSQSLNSYRRYEILVMAAELLAKRRDEVIKLMIAETGFTYSDCTNDFNRCLQTLHQSAEEAKRVAGDVVPIQGAPGQRDERIAFTIRMPVGIVCAITPFNSPLNTVAHKVAPSIAAGNATVLKPSLHTPLSAIVLCEVLEQAGLPAGFLNLVHGSGEETGIYLLQNKDVDYYTFTGSTRVGEIIQRHAGLRRTQLELGNISATIIFPDANLSVAAEKVVAASFRKAGQVCTSVQRLLVHESIIDELSRLLVRRTAQLKVGDPRESDTFVGPMIDEKQAIRAKNWIDEAVSAGADVVLGGRREGALLYPTVLRRVSSQYAGYVRRNFRSSCFTLPVPH